MPLLQLSLVLSTLVGFCFLGGFGFVVSLNSITASQIFTLVSLKEVKSSTSLQFGSVELSISLNEGPRAERHQFTAGKRVGGETGAAQLLGFKILGTCKVTPI